MGQRCEPGNSWIVRGADVDGGNGAGKADAFGNSGLATLHTDVPLRRKEFICNFLGKILFGSLRPAAWAC